MSEPSTDRAERAANLFDLRRIIGGVFLAWGVLLTILGITESDAEIEKAAGININLYAGLGMLVVAIIFLVWAFTHPLGKELREDYPRGSAGGDDERPLGRLDPGRQQREPRPAEAAADHPGAGGPGGLQALD